MPRTERPIRNFEHLTDISGSWSKEKTMNCFMVKPSPYSLSLAVRFSFRPTSKKSCIAADSHNNWLDCPLKYPDTEWSRRLRDQEREME